MNPIANHKSQIKNSLPLFLLIMLSTAGGADSPAPWESLFDGKNTAQWRSFKKESFPAQGWVVEDAILKKKAGVRGGDIVTREAFDDFELEWEWRIPARANNGIKYFITEERAQAIGHEYQMIDDAEVKDGKQATGSFYDVLAPDPGKPATRLNEWNQSRVVVRGNQVEHWLNGKRILQYELGSPAVREAVAQSKFKTLPGFGTKIRGHILLTDHNDEAWYRQIRIRRLTPK